MGRVERYPGGTFCWLDLATTDVHGAGRFYEQLFGWQVDAAAGRAGDYTIARVDGLDVAGIGERSPDEAIGWRSYVAVYDVAETAERAGELGAVVVDRGRVPEVAEYATIRDPVGARVTLWQPEGQGGARLVNEVGTWCWNELVTRDLDAAIAFYGGLFGWASERRAGPIERVSFTMGDLLIGAAHAPAPGERPDPRWDVAFRVATTDDAVDRVRELGGAVLLPAMDVPVGRFAVVGDPFGAAMTLSEFAGPIRGADGS